MNINEYPSSYNNQTVNNSDNKPELLIEKQIGYFIYVTNLSINKLYIGSLLSFTDINNETYIGVITAISQNSLLTVKVFSYISESMFPTVYNPTIYNWNETTKVSARILNYIFV